MIDRRRVTNIRSVGHSYPFGYYATNFYGYAQQLGPELGVAFANNAVSGTRFIHAIAAVLARPPRQGELVLFGSGLNDLRLMSGTKTTAKFEGIINALCAATFCKTAVAASSLYKTFSGTFDAMFSKAYNLGGHGRIGASGEVAEYAFDGDNVIIGWMASDGVTRVNGDIGVTVDGQSIGTISCNNLTDAAAADEPYAPNCSTFSGFGPGPHLLSLHANANTTMLDWIGTLNEQWDCPQIMVSEIVHLSSDGSAGFGVSNATIDTANAGILSAVNGWRGYPVTYVDSNRYYVPSTDASTTAVQGDPYHPIDIGHTHILQAHLRLIK